MGLKGVDDKVTIVTGAAQGIGRVYAQGFAAEGGNVVAVDLNEEGLRQTVQEIERAGGKAIAVAADVSDESSTQEMAQVALSAFGGIDILVNNAAIYAGLQLQGPLEINGDVWDQIMRVNVKGIWLATKAVVPTMRTRGGGSIINQSSTAAHGVPFSAHYCASKGGVNSLTKALARDLGDYNIRVNSVAPGVTDTEATREIMSSEGIELALSRRCLKRIGTPFDMLGAALFLASDMSSYMTGQILTVDGGGQMMG